ncbi:MAG: myo-inositol-1-phosphate synthase, partial [Actinomycetia bacterium]|nr:myo-inositol-1-phosphate synthase [Actinomycetes bacterium]
MDEKVGIWFVGARGSLATTATLGLHALASRLAAPTGCVTELDDLDARGLPAYDRLVTGGHDVSDLPLPKRAEQLVAGGVVSPALVEALADGRVGFAAL